MALDDLDPMTADPAGFEIALELPEQLGLIENGAQLEFAATRGTTGETLGGEYTLLEHTLADGRTIYRIPQNGIEDIRALQQNAATWDATDDTEAGDNELSVGVQVDFCRKTEDVLAEDLRFSVFIRLAKNAPLLPLVRNGRVTEVVETDALNELDICEVR
jgi:hypothetical protein